MIRDRSPALRRSAFTLLEILIVVAIIVVVAGVGGVYLFGALDTGKGKAAEAQMKQLETAVEMYRANNDSAPQSLEVLFQADPRNSGNPYLKDRRVLLDPWGKPYNYRYDGPQGPVISTTNPNGQILSNAPLD